MTKPNFQAAADVLHGWRDDVLSGKPPTFYPIGDGELSRIEIGPGLVTLLGGAPGAGKTAFVMQSTVDALRLTPTLRAVVCNIEMPPAVLLDRQLARLSGVDLTTIRYRRLTEEHAGRIDAGLNTLDELADRLAFVRPPFDLENVAAVADEFDAGLIVLDYIQRIQPPGEHGDKRGSVDATMSHLRAFADAGVAVIVLSAVGRTKDAKGRSSYHGDGLNLASFRESSELEFGADDAFILTPDDAADDEVILRHLKSRNGECRDLRLQFDKPHQAFTPLGGGESTSTTKREPRGKLQAAIADLWGRTDAADDDAAADWGAA
jgi:replicative DNA helicase